MNAEIRNLIFDFGNVIVDLDHNAVRSGFARMGIDVSRFLGLSVQRGIFLELELGQLSPDEWCAKLMEMAPEFQLPDSELNVTVQGIKDAWNSMLARVPLRRLEALQQLGKKYRISLLSNTNQLHIDHSFNAHIRKQGFEPNELFEHLFLSHEMHLAKPGREIFEEVLRRSGYKAEETLFIDDSADNCAAFAQLGVQTFCPKHPDEWLGLLCPSVASIGFFDGVHLGHQHLIGQVKDEARHRGMDSVLVTFAQHPRAVLHSDYVPELLSSPQEKLALLKQTGVDRVEMLDFTPKMSQFSAKEFMQVVLYKRLGVRVLVMGYDHRFGHGGGSWDDYQRWAAEVGIEVVRATELPSGPCSSSAIRRLIGEGRVAEAAELLGHPYTLSGRVVSGHQVGRELGFPTANLQPFTNKLVPCRGVYAVKAMLEDGTSYPGMLNIGERPTVDNSHEQTIEVNLLGFEGNLYERNVTIEFVQFLRHEQRFDSIDALVTQIRKDREAAMQALDERNG